MHNVRLRQSVRILRGAIWLAVPLVGVLIFGRSLLPESSAAADAAVAGQERDLEAASAAADGEASAEAVSLLNDWAYTDTGDETADEKSPTDPGEDGGDQTSDEKGKQGGDGSDQPASAKPKRT
jgi:hypothetical protein